MQSVIVAVFAVLACASAGNIAVAPVAVHHAVPVVHAAPAVVHTRVVPVAHSQSFNYRAPAARVITPVAVATPVVHHAPIVHHAPVVAVRHAPIAVAHAAPVLVH